MVFHRTGYFNDKSIGCLLTYLYLTYTVVKYTLCLSSTFTHIVVSHTVVYGCIVQLSVNKFSYQSHCVPV